MKRAEYREPADGEIRQSGTVLYPNPDGITSALIYSCRECARSLGKSWLWSPFPNECRGCGCALA